MILLSSIFAGIIAGLLRGGNLRNLGKVHIHWAWVVLVALIVQAIFIRGLPDWTWAARVVFPLTHAAILAVAWLNRDLDGMWLVAAGVALNVIAMLANGGLMPIPPEALVQAGLAPDEQSVALYTRLINSKGIILPKQEATLWWLGDVIALRPVETVISIGDIVLVPGLFLFVYGAMLQQED